jgi:2OG-Fe(II) oxygenase superfamily
MLIGKSGVTVSAAPEVLSGLRAEFERQHYLKVPQLLDPELLEFVQLQIDQADFYERVHEGIGTNRELCMTSNSALAALQFLVNDQQLFGFVQQVTQCDRIGCFQGRVYRVKGDAGHHDSWHDDLGEDRLVGMSINLSRETYAGGALQLRDRASGEVVSEVPNVGPGDALIFRLSQRFQHRVTRVEGFSAKTAFAGWFRAQPDFVALLRRRVTASRRGLRVRYSVSVGETRSDLVH